MKKGYNLVQVIIIVVVTAIISGLTIGVIVYSGKNKVNYQVLLQDENVKEFLNAYAEVTSQYFEDLDKSILIKGAINGMMDNLSEAYSTYMDEDAAGNLIGSLTSTFSGIGVIFENGKIINVLDSSPASKVGIEENDQIVSINGVEVSSLSDSEITALMEDADKVTLVITRNNEEYSFELFPETLSVPQVKYKLIDDSTIGYIKIGLFSSNVASETNNALNRLKRMNASSFIIDLRGNSGGYLDKTYDTISLFLEKGKLMYYIQGKEGKQPYYDETYDNIENKIVVLVNKQTASAAEILASSLKDSNDAILVGETTFGKGKVQHTYDLTSGGLIKYTTAKWLRSNGSCIDLVGLDPDYSVSQIENSDIDNQLNTAIELLNA